MAEPDILSQLGQIPSYIFGGDTNQTAEGIKTRREAILRAMIAARQRKFPQTTGEGISALGEAVGDRMAERRLNAAEAAQLRGDAAARTGAPPLATPPVSQQPQPRAPALPAAAPAPPPAAATPPVTMAPVRAAEPPPGTPMGAQPIDQVASALQAQVMRSPNAPPEVVQPNPTLPGAEPPVQAMAFQPQTTRPSPDRGGLSTTDDDEIWNRRQEAIGSIETGGREDGYATVGVETNGDRPYGRYQIMGQNIPQWSQAALGYTLTPQQFLAGGKPVQDAIFRHRFGQYVARYGDEGAARAWFAGEGNMNNLRGRDRLGTTVGSYGQQYMSRFGAPAPTGGGDEDGTSAAEGETVFDEGQPVTSAAQPRRTIAGAIDPLSGLLTPTPMNPRTSGAPAATGGRNVTPGVPATVGPDLLDTRPTELPDPGPEPTPEPPTPRMEYWRRLATDPYRSDLLRTEAAANYEREKTLQDAAFTRRYERWKEAVTKKRDYELELPGKRIELQQKAADLEKARIHESEGRFYVRQPDGRLRDITPEPDAGGENPPVVRGLSSEEGKVLTYHRNALTAIGQFNRIKDADKILSEGLRDELAGRLPFVGNAALRDKYRQAKEAAIAIVNSSLRQESGAAIGVQELATKYRNLIPVYGDDPATIANKRQLREGVPQGLYESTGKGRVIADWQRKHVQRQFDAEDLKQFRKDREALDWARANPNDPRAAKILREAGGR